MASSVIGQFVQALDEEIVAIKRGKAGSVVKLFRGRFLREISGLFIYAFNLDNFLAAVDDSPAEIEIEGTRYTAEVLLTQALEVEVGVEQWFGPFIPEATLHTNLWYLLELLKKKFAECQTKRTTVDFRLSERIFSSTQADSTRSSQAGITYSVYKDPPNEAQAQAINASFCSPVCVIWGPPGTGKTKTVAKAIEAHLNAGRRVLLVSHANNAVDQALESVAAQLKTSPLYQEGKLVRVGKPQEEHLKRLERCYEMVLLDNIAAKLGQSLSREKGALESEKGDVESTMNLLDKAVGAFQMATVLSREIDTLRASRDRLEKESARARRELHRLKRLQAENERRLVDARVAGAVRRFFSGLDPGRIQREIDSNSVQIDSKTRQVKEMYTRLGEIKQSCQTKSGEFAIARRESHAILEELGIARLELADRNKALAQRKDAILARIAELDRQLDEIQNKVLSEARLVATTLTKTFLAKQIPDVAFDVLIVDEASMAPLPHLYWAAGRCRQFATIVGDFRQLPPICIAKDKAMARQWLGRSVFDVLGISSVEGAQHDVRVSLLDTQYRMVPAIADISNRLFYSGVLKNDPRTSGRECLSDGVSESPLVLVETSAMNAWCSRRSSGSRFNLYSALVCATLSKRIIEHTREGSLGIATPYAAQARLINKIARDWGMLDRLRVSTIHRFQGAEQRVIIFDTVEGQGGRGIPPMLDDTKRDSDAQRVLNVALTRAENRLYVVGNTEYLLSSLHADSALSRIIRHFQDHGETLQSETLVDNYFTTDFEKWADALLSTTRPTHEAISGALYTERNFWAQFFLDLKTVKQRVMILSPFVSVRRAGMSMDYFRAMIMRGVKITIYTRPANDQTGHMAYQAEVVVTQLRNIGVSVVERRNMHQKVAILDDSVAWEGSLNILSHRDSGEHMRRFEGHSTIQEIIRNLELDEEMAVGTQTPERCPLCQDGYLVVRAKYGRKFLGCSNFYRQKCPYTRPIHESRRAPQLADLDD